MRMPAKEIRLHDVTFAYPAVNGAGAPPVLEHFDLTIPAGSSLAIVGQNGAGKTTIAKLLCRLYDPQSGAITIDGADLREFDLASWRARVTAVFQDFIRLELPLRENVAPAGAPDHDSARLRSRRRVPPTWPRSIPSWPADIPAAPTSPEASGSALPSPGRWPQSSLGAGVVLLDEPTAQLDVRGEAEIFDRLLAATRHCTTILISHRFSTVRHADRICVLEKGRVVELGTHDELMALGGRYRTMFDLQAQRFHLPEQEGVTDSMMPSPKTDPGLEPLPPALQSMWRLCKLGYRHEPRLMIVSFALSQLAALPDALLALWLWLLGKGVLQHRTVWIEMAAVGLGVSTAATWFLRTISTRVQRRFRDKVTIALESHVARLQATVETVAHHERPEYLDRLSMLRNQVFVLDHMYMSLFSTLGWILRLGVTMALLASIHPALLLLAVFAIPTVLTSGWRPAVERAAQERGAQSGRLARHLFTIATTAAPGKEVRVTGIGERLVHDRRAAWERWYGPVAAVALGLGLVAGAGMGDLWPGLCGRGGFRFLLSARACQLGAAGAGRGRAALGLHWRYRG